MGWFLLRSWLIVNLVSVIPLWELRVKSGGGIPVGCPASGDCHVARKWQTSLLRPKIWVLGWCNNIGFKSTHDFSQFSLVNWRLKWLIFLNILTVLWVLALLFFPTVINVKMAQVVQMVAGSVSHLLDRGTNLSSALTWWDLSLEKQSAISKPKSSELTRNRSERELEVVFQVWKITFSCASKDLCVSAVQAS